MNDKLILDLTVQLTQALDQNYDVVNMDTVLAVLSALEGATITKEQLGTTRLAKHINQLRRRNKSNILAIRAKNLLKTWREMVGITSQVQSEVGTSANPQVQSTHQQAPKPAISGSSKPTSPYATQLLSENFENSLSSIGGGVDISRSTTEGTVNTEIVNYAWNKKLSANIGEGGGGAGIISSRSNGALTDTQTRLTKSSNRYSKNSNSPILPGTTTKVKHPTSFKNLLTGFNTNSVSNKQKNAPILSNKINVQMSNIGREEHILSTNSNTFRIDDDNNQSHPSTTAVVEIQVSSSHTHKSIKRKERDSPESFTEHFHSTSTFENVSESKRNSQVGKNTNSNQVLTSTIDLPDSNSSSTFANALCDTTENIVVLSAAKDITRVQKDKQKDLAAERIEHATESENFQPNIDESSRIAFPISGIQEYLSLSNSSMSIFPSQHTAGSGETEGYAPKLCPNDSQQLNLSNEQNNDVIVGDLTFAGKFKQNSNSCAIDVEPTGNYFSNGKETLGFTTADFTCSDIKGMENNCRDSLSAGGTASTSTFLPFSRNSNDSSSNSRASQLDLIDVVNQDSQSLIIVDDFHQQGKPSVLKSKTNRDVESVPESQHSKYTKETSNKLKQLKEQSKSAVVQRLINISSKSSTPTPISSVVTAVSTIASYAPEQKVPKKRGRKKGSKGVDSVLAQMSGLGSQFLVSPALGSSKKVKTTMELLADIQNRKLGSATSSPTLMNWFGTSRPASSCSEPSLHSPRTLDACSTNATISIAPRSTPEKNIINNSVGVDELYESDSDSSTSHPSHDSIKVSLGSKDSMSKSSETEGVVVTTAVLTSTIEAQIKELMTKLPPVNINSIDWKAYEDVPCTCTLREISPKAVIEIDMAKVKENGLGLLNDVESSREKDNRQNDEEPIISVNVFPPAHPQQHSADSKHWSTPTITALHALSAPGSTVTSPVVPSTNQKMKSIFDLDFDDDNDPLHSFVEAAAKTQNLRDPPTATENGKIKYSEDATKQKNSLNFKVLKCETQQSELTQQSSSIESAPYQHPQSSLEMVEPMMQPFLNFPTYEVVEDPNCQAKLRYDTQTNQITQFHINAFHNCFIPNVNGNWDHSVPQNFENTNLHKDDDNLYVSVVPKYGCFVTERIPKDLSHVKFTRNFKPKRINKSDKPPPPFLGVVNIHRRQYFRLHPNQNVHRRHHKKSIDQRRDRTILAHIKPEVESEAKRKKEDHQKEYHREKECEKKTINVLPYIPENNTSVPNNTKNSAENIFAEKHRLSPTHVPEFSQINIQDTSNYCEKSHHEQHRVKNNHNIADIEFSPAIVDMDLSNDRGELAVHGLHTDQVSDFADGKTSVANGSVHPLMNNNTIVHGSEEAMQGEVMSNIKSAMQNNILELIDGRENELAASRRSSSCSNSSLKQNQNSINMKLRRHRLAQRQAEIQKRHWKRKNMNSYSDVFDFEVGGDDQPQNPPLIKRIKIVNGGVDGRRRITNSIEDSSCMEEDGDSDCYPFNSENDIITEEEGDEDGDERAPPEIDGEEDYEDVVDEYDEDDGDDEEELEEDYGDFREVVTRDMTSSTTGNNHIVLTIKKTPSKTNSPSSSSMSPVVNANVKQLSMSPTIRVVDSAGENSVEDFTKTVDQHETGKLNLTTELVDLDAVKTEGLIKESKSYLPKRPYPLTVYNFELKENGDIENENSANEDNEANGRSYENEASEEMAAAATGTSDETEKYERKECTSKVSQINSNGFSIVTKTKLSESIFLTRRELHRLELKKRLKDGIEEARKLHRQLFFPYELHTSMGSKILEINSCTSGCTDPSEDETDVTDSNASRSSTDDEDALFRIRKRKRTKLPTKRRNVTSEGGGDPSSSSSTSGSSDSNSSTSSYSAFTSWTSSDGEDEKSVLLDKEKENDEKNLSLNLNDTESYNELPLENNYLLRSFNHIYVSTAERQRQHQLKEAAECRRREIMNAGYITVTGTDSEKGTSKASISSLPLSDNCDVYSNYNNFTYNIYSKANNSNGIRSLTIKQNVTKDAEFSKPIESLLPVAGTTPMLIEREPPSQTIAFSIAQNSGGVQQTPKENMNPECKKILTNTEDNSPDSLSDSPSKTNESVQKKAEIYSRPDKGQDEHQTGLREVGEDADDEDGNNCARTRQFKEWHEVLQLRSYNDELLTVLPYVVIE